MPTAELLTQYLREEYNRIYGESQVAVSTGALAEVVFRRIDPAEVSPALVRTAAVLELKQLARGICARHKDDEPQQDANGHLFEFRLQRRYPTKRHGEDVYVLREYLTCSERLENERRLRLEADAKTAHADALAAETQYLIQTGKLADTEQPEPVSS